MRMTNPSPVLDKNHAPMGPESYPVLGLGSGGRLVGNFQTPVLYWISSVCKNRQNRDVHKILCPQNLGLYAPQGGERGEGDFPASDLPAEWGSRGPKFVHASFVDISILLKELCASVRPFPMEPLFGNFIGAISAY